MKKIFFLIFVIFITVVSFELFLRYSPFSSGISPVEYDKDIGMWHKKDFESYLVKECYKNLYSFDSLGRVKNSYDYDENKKNIVILGDSQIEALMVKNDKIIHNSLYKEFNGKYNVLNYGLSGTGPTQHYQILENKVDLSNTDYILHFVFLENDLNDGDPKNFTNSNRPKVYMKFTDMENYEVIKPKRYDTKEKIRDLLGNFEFYGYIKKTIYYYKLLLESRQPNQEVSQVKKTNFELENEEYKWKQLFGSIYQIDKLSKINDIKYRLVIYSIDELSYNNAQKREFFERFLVEHDIVYTNMVPFLNNIKKIQKLEFDCDGHWNEHTHQEIARYISKNWSKDD